MATVKLEDSNTRKLEDSNTRDVLTKNGWSTEDHATDMFYHRYKHKDFPDHVIYTDGQSFVHHNNKKQIVKQTITKSATDYSGINNLQDHLKKLHGK